MIIFFSGTGNSKLVAKQLAELLHENLHNMECGNTPHLEEGEPIGIVFPVYAWGLPQIVESYLRKMDVSGRYLWAVMTCGDDMGYADKRLEKALQHKVNAAFSVQMPNTYVCLPGFKVDSDEVAQRKVNTTQERLSEIAGHIQKKEGCRQLTRGGAAWMKTYMLRPVFNRFLVTDKYFRTSKDCNACGLCAKQCPTHNISLCSHTPMWNRTDCTGCLRCFHKCPQRAIDWGKYTKGKKQVQKV